MELDIKNPGGGNASPGFKKPKLKLNKKTIVIGGVIVIVAFLVLRKVITPTHQQQSVAMGSYGDEYGSNTVDTNAQLQNAQSIMEQNVNTTLSQFMADIQSQMNTNNSEVMGYVGSSLNELTSGMTTALNNQQQTFNDSLQQQNDKFASFTQSNNEVLNGLTQQLTGIKQNQGSSGGVLQPKPTTTPGVLKTGTFKSTTDAEKFAKDLRTNYGGTNVQVVNEGGQFRVLSNFKDSTRANKVLARAQELGKIKTGYAS